LLCLPNTLSTDRYRASGGRSADRGHRASGGRTADRGRCTSIEDTHAHFKLPESISSIKLNTKPQLAVVEEHVCDAAKPCQAM
jgi:hypothetical protein